MKIEFQVPVIVSCANMHTHWWDNMWFEYDDSAPLEVIMALRDRAPHGDPHGSTPDVTWVMPRVDFADAVQYGVRGQVNRAGIASVKIRNSDPRIIILRVPYTLDDDQSQDQYFMFRKLKLESFLRKVERSVPYTFLDSMTNIDHLIGKLLYS